MSNGLSNKSQSPILVTGAAGFIGAKTVELLLAEGHTVVGVDNLNDYYDVRLKNYRVNTLLGQAEILTSTPNLCETSTGLVKAKSAVDRFPIPACRRFPEKQMFYKPFEKNKITR